MSEFGIGFVAGAVTMGVIFALLVGYAICRISGRISEIEEQRRLRNRDNQN